MGKVNGVTEARTESDTAWSDIDLRLDYTPPAPAKPRLTDDCFWIRAAVCAAAGATVPASISMSLLWRC